MPPAVGDINTTRALSSWAVLIPGSTIASCRRMYLLVVGACPSLRGTREICHCDELAASNCGPADAGGAPSGFLAGWLPDVRV